MNLHSWHNSSPQVGAVKTWKRRQDAARGGAGAIGRRSKSLGRELAILDVEHGADQDYFARESLAQEVGPSVINTGEKIGERVVGDAPRSAIKVHQQPSIGSGVKDPIANASFPVGGQFWNRPKEAAGKLQGESWQGTGVTSQK